jgi:hypothetical protein
VTYYLLLQDRITEALGMFDRIDAAPLQSRLQYDYFAGYLAFYREQSDVAHQIAVRYADYPVDRWRTAFRTIDQHLDQAGGSDVEVLDPEDRNQRQVQLAATEASFDFDIQARQVHVHYQNVSEVQVNYYLMDIELLFSRNPFVQQFSGQFSSIRPNRSEKLALPPGQATVTFPLPEELHSANLLIELVGGGKTQAHAHYANSLTVQLNENYGQLQVTDAGSGKPLPTTYVKVYAKMRDGSVNYYKDGYTDLRGRFDYASLSTSELEQVDRFSLLVLNETQGAVIREAAVPQQ